MLVSHAVYGPPRVHRGRMLERSPQVRGAFQSTRPLSCAFSSIVFYLGLTCDSISLHYTKLICCAKRAGVKSEERICFERYLVRGQTRQQVTMSQRTYFGVPRLGRRAVASQASVVGAVVGVLPTVYPPPRWANRCKNRRCHSVSGNQRSIDEALLRIP